MRGREEEALIIMKRTSGAELAVAELRDSKKKH